MRIIMMLVCLVPFLAGLIGVHVISDSNPYARLACLWITFSYTATWTLSISLVIANTAGHTKQTTSNAALIMGYCLGNFCGPFFFQSQQAPRYPLGVGMMFFYVAMQVVIIAAIFAVLYTRNEKRNVQNVSEDSNAVIEVDHVLDDATDMNNKDFRVREPLMLYYTLTNPLSIVCLLVKVPPAQGSR